jgi:ADP-heptose:LPS heptosyltransferase
VAINVNAGDTFLERRWPGNRFAQLVKTLAGDDESIFCFIGNEEESEYVEDVISQTSCAGRCMNISGKLTIPELAALLQRSELLISNDSGPLHLAAALGIPTVALYGPESPGFYGTVNAVSTIIYKNISCSPCMNIYSAKQFRCPFNARCMTEISVEEVLESVRSAVLVN